MKYKNSDDTPVENTGVIKLHGEEGFEGMRKAGQLAAETLDMIAEHVVPGITTDELNTLCHDFITERGGICAPLGYRGFTKSICTSVNHVVCHGIPGPKKLLNGDIVNIDVTPTIDGWHGDTSRMFVAGKANVKAKRLIDLTYECLMRGIDVVKPGATTATLVMQFSHMQKKTDALLFGISAAMDWVRFFTMFPISFIMEPPAAAKSYELA